MRMRYWCRFWTLLCVIVLAGLGARAQSAGNEGQKPDDKAKAAQSAQPEIPPDSPVITLHGLCDSGLFSTSNPPSPPTHAKALSPDCQTVITRQQWESMLGGVGVIPRAYHVQSSAEQISKILAVATKGRELGTEQDPRFQAKRRYSYIVDLAQWAKVSMQETADSVSDDDVEQFYKEHPEQFVQSHIFQIVIPKKKDPEALKAKTPAAKAALKADPDGSKAMHRLALRIRQRAAAGADPDKLVEEAYNFAHNPSPPNTDLGMQVPDIIPVAYRKIIFDLNPGQVSEITENDHEYMIFKCVDKHPVPPAERKRFVGFIRMRAVRRELMDSVKPEFNQQYFTVKRPSNEEESGGITPEPGP